MLTVSHISKTFNPGTVNEKCAIRDLSLHLDPGDFVTIIGANGAGKSTLFNAIAGSFYTDSGPIPEASSWTAAILLSSRSTAGRRLSAACSRTPCSAAPPA